MEEVSISAELVRGSAHSSGSLERAVLGGGTGSVP